MNLPQRVGCLYLLLCVGLVNPALAEPPALDTGTTEPGSTRINIHRRGQQGETLLHWVVFEGDIDMVRQLIDAGANVNARVEKGATPLHMAAYRGHTNIARLLLDHGAQVNAETDTGVTPLDWAQRNHNAELIQLLRGKGAKRGRGAVSEPQPAQPATARAPRPIRLDPLQLSLDYQAGDKHFDPATQPAHSELRLVTDEEGNSQKRGRSQKVGSSQVQLGAYSSEKRARAAWAVYRKRHPELLAGHELLLDETTLQDRHYHRVRIGGLSQDAARALCEGLSAREQPCRVIPPR